MNNNNVLTESTMHRWQGAEELIRRGLIPLDHLPLLRTALVKVDSNIYLPFMERSVYYQFVRSILDIIFSDPTIKRLVQNRASMRKHESIESDDESILREDVDLRKVPDGMLMAYANAARKKKANGGKPTESDKKMASRAKTEIRRRKLLAMRGAQAESLDTTIQSIMAECGVNSIGDMTPEQLQKLSNALNGATT